MQAIAVRDGVSQRLELNKLKRSAPLMRQRYVARKDSSPAGAAVVLRLYETRRSAYGVLGGITLLKSIFSGAHLFRWHTVREKLQTSRSSC